MFTIVYSLFLLVTPLVRYHLHLLSCLHHSHHNVTQQHPEEPLCHSSTRFLFSMWVSTEEEESLII